jgi:hypothetical protein
VSRAVQIEFVAADAARTTRKPDNVDAQDFALRCEAATIINSDKRGPAFALCEQALRLDDRNVLALSLLADKILASVDSGLSVDPDGDVRKAYEMTLQALAADPNDSLAHFVHAHALLRQSHEGRHRRGKTQSRSQSELHQRL